ncbi:MAG TPA: metal ABC transporter substrate-binding protein [Methylomusa anaerophila]|uniref:High-affinity zinc uptake system binding-protein ZnuA n=1 Tax=Methylomusa anaerophila TaxID=1930071 RepID=A0A348AL53_9FIRM|nr:metal ABC transporter substrate-binding protein [Methylomusa anaerophila]BBB91801.1 high-affinity zinc uptake system binding-protein ZnuA precursor [Methylomusa anaerophila]HML88464.1 metal ABC transporter substrate-binding protein [Methylomusa anaerophila]
MLKRWVAMLLCLVAIVSFSACSSNSDSASKRGGSNIPGSGAEEKIKVSVTFDAIKEFVAAVGKDKVEISVIIPAGTEPHDFEPKARDLASLSAAKVFVYNGLGMEAWAEEAIQAANNNNLIVVDASKGADVITKETTSENHEEGADHKEGHDHGKYDPHLWLSLKGAQTEVKNIKDALVQADPSNKDYYEQNGNNFISQLGNLYNEYNGKFQSVAKKNFVTGHAAFGYLCRDFGLEQNSVSDIYAEGEPSAQQLAKLVEYCRANNVTTIFAEEMASPKVSQTLANEVGAKVETIYTIESAEDNMTYLERMERNLSKIYDSLTK